MALSARERTALTTAIHRNEAAQVQRLAYGRYEVPSATEAGTVYVVTGTALDGSDHRCTCAAGQHGQPCHHVAAVRLRRVQEEAQRQARHLAQREPGAASSSARAILEPSARTTQRRVALT